MISKHYAKIFAKKLLNDKVLWVKLELTEPSEILFLPGQFINVRVTDTAFRSYSICSPSSQTKFIELFIQVGHEGLAVTFFTNAKEGDTVEFIGPSGKFTLPKSLDKNLVFIATGTGIAPILSMLYKLAEESCNSQIFLYFGVRNDSELFALEEIKSFSSRLSNFEYKICFSRELPKKAHDRFFLGRVTSALNLGDITNTQYFICGNPNMLSEVIGVLKQSGVGEEKIFHEGFTVSK